jgi:Zn-dependent protease
MFRFRGIDARIHLFTLIYFVTEVLWSIPRTNAGWLIMLGFMASLFVVVLLHEFGHCFACRWAGGESNRLVMLPFGGLAYTLPPHEWRAHLITTLGGPAVNVVLAVVTSVALVAMGRGDHVLFDPLSPLRSMPGQAATNAGLIAVVLVWQFHVANIIILGFNLLLPFFPFDGGRVVQELLWWRVGYRRSMSIATAIGMVGSGGLLVFAGVSGQTTLLMIAIFGLWACWTERQRLRFADDPTMAATGLGVPSGGGVVRRGPTRAEVRAKERAARDAAELDRILAKIADHGLPSLTGSEKRSLERLRKQKKRGPGVGAAEWS